MAATPLHGRPVVSGSVEAIAATDSTTSAPTSSTDGFDTGPFPRVRTLLLYDGTVDNTLNLRIWFRDRATGEWYGGADTDGFDELAGSTGGNESRDWEVGRNQEIFFQIAAIAGGGDVSVRVQPIDTGQRW